MSYYPAQGDAFAKQRALQIDAVIRRHPNARVFGADKSVIDIPLPIKSKNGDFQLTFRVYLDANFPQKAPRVQVLAQVEHYNVDGSGFVQHPKLSSAWSGVHASLADTLSDVFTVFKNSPPKVISITNTPPPVQQQPQPQYPPQPQQGGYPPSASGYGMPPQNNIPQYSGYPPQQQQPIMNNSQMDQRRLSLPQQPQQQPQPAAQRPISLPPQQDSYQQQQIAKFDELSALSEEQLQALLQNEEALDDFVDNLDFVKSNRSGAAETMKQLRESLAKLAKSNIEKDGELRKMADASKQFEELMRAAEVQLQNLQAQQLAIGSRYQPPQLLALLNQKLQASEEETDELYDKFLSEAEINDESIGNFTKMYMEKRKLFYVRKTKKERFQKIFIK